MLSADKSDMPNAPQREGHQPTVGVPGTGMGDAVRPSSSRGVWKAAWVIFTVALLVRLTYLFEIRNLPFVESPMVDASSYDQWARRIAGGDWWGEKVFYQAPGYPYFLAVVYTIFGTSVWAAHVVQMVIGALSCVLIYLAGRLWFNSAAGATGAMILAFYAPAIFYDGLIQKAGLGLFLLSLFMYVLARAHRGPNARTFALCGMVAGLLALTRENAALFVGMAPVWIALHFKDRPRVIRLRWSAAFLLTVSAVLVPVAVRNLAVGGTFAFTTTQFGSNFYIGNNPDATGLYKPLIPGRGNPQFERRDATVLAQRAVGAALTPGEVSRYWFRRGLEFVREEPRAWLTLLWRKWLLVWNYYEIPDAEAMVAYSDESMLLNGLGTVSHFGLLAPLGAAGIVMTLNRRRELWILYVLLILYAAGVALFFVFGRYRLPLVPFLALFAGAACVGAYKWLRSKSIGRLVPPAAVAAAAALAANQSILSESFFQSCAYANLGKICLGAGRERKAEQYLTRAIEMNPEYHPGQVTLGLLRLWQGRTDEAISLIRKGVALNPSVASSHKILARALSQRGDREEAIASYRQALQLQPDLTPARRELASQLIKKDLVEEAMAELEQAAALAPRDAGVPFDIANIHRNADRLAEAVAQYQRAIELDPTFAEAHSNLGTVYGRLGELEAAVRHYRLAIAAVPELLEAHYNLGTTLGRMDRFEEAADAMQRCLELAVKTGRGELLERIRGRLAVYRDVAEVPNQ